MDYYEKRFLRDTVYVHKHNTTSLNGTVPDPFPAAIHCSQVQSQVHHDLPGRDLEKAVVSRSRERPGRGFTRRKAPKNVGYFG